MRRVIGIICCLCTAPLLLPNPAQALDKDGARTCVLAIAKRIESLKKHEYDQFIGQVFALDAAITKGTQIRDWKHTESRARSWPDIARKVLKTRTLPALKDIEVNDIQPGSIRVRGAGNTYAVSGVTSKNIEVSVSVRSSGQYGCMITDASALQQSISGLIGAEIKESERTKGR